MFADPVADMEITLKELAACEALSSDDLVRAGSLLLRFEAVFAQHARLLDALGAGEIEGYGSSRSWLAHTTRMSGSAASRHLQRGRYSYACDASGAAWLAGEITGEHIDAMARIRHRARDDGAFARFEPALLDVARTCTPSEVADIGQRWLARLEAERESREAQSREHDDDGSEDPDGSGDADDTEHAIDRSTANPFDGILTDPSILSVTDETCGFRLLDGRFSNLDMAQILTALNSEVERCHTEGDGRPRAERLAEALVSIATKYNSQQINAGTNSPHIVAGLDVAVLTDEKIGPITTTTGIRLSRAEMQRLACNAVLWIVTEGGERVPLDLHRTERRFNRAQRRALERRDGHTCAFPGCRAPVDRAEAHHCDWWRLGGATDTANGVLLCPMHHKAVHEGR